MHYSHSVQEKSLLEVHVSGFPETLQDEEQLTTILNEIAVAKGLNIEPGNPIVSTRINAAGRFAFATFRTKEEAQRGLELNGSLCLGNILKVDKPKFSLGLGKQGLSIEKDERQIVAAVLAASPSLPHGMNREELRIRLESSLQRIGESTSIVELSNVVGASLQDIENEVKRYGTAVGIKPHPNESDTFLVKMQNYQEAEKLVQMKRSFQNHRVIARFRPVTEWNSLVANN